MENDDLERLGKMSDRLDNVSYVAKLNVPPKIVADALLSTVIEVRDELRAFLKSKGFDFWSADDV